MGTRNIKVTARKVPGTLQEGTVLSGTTVQAALFAIYQTNNLDVISKYQIRLGDQVLTLHNILDSDCDLILTKNIKGEGPEYTPSDRIVVYYCPQREKKKRKQTIETFFLKWDVPWPDNVIVEQDRKGRTSFIDQADLLDHQDVTLVVYNEGDLLNKNIVPRIDDRITLIVVSEFEDHPVSNKGRTVIEHDQMIKKRLWEFSEPKKPQRSSRQYDVDRGYEREERNRKLWSWTRDVMGSFLDEKARARIDLPFNDDKVLGMINRIYSQQIEKNFGTKEQKKSNEPVTISFANFQARLNELGFWDEYENLKQKNRELDRKKRFS